MCNAVYIPVFSRRILEMNHRKCYHFQVFFQLKTQPYLNPSSKEIKRPSYSLLNEMYYTLIIIILHLSGFSKYIINKIKVFSLETIPTHSRLCGTTIWAGIHKSRSYVQVNTHHAQGHCWCYMLLHIRLASTTSGFGFIPCCSCYGDRT